jgi:hypothetical protein
MAQGASTLVGSHEVVTIDPFFDEGPEGMVELCEQLGTYRTYAEHEKLDSELTRGLSQRHDSVLNFLRTGGLHGARERTAVLAARTTYFREEYAYGDRILAPGIEGFLHHPRLLAAAQRVHGSLATAAGSGGIVVEPAIAYANLMVPGQELAVHTDVPEFRGANRKVLPQWLLVVMHHSGLFADWRMHIATGISWWHDSDHGALAYWPDGADGPSRSHRIAANTALVLDTDTVFHGVDRVTDPAPSVVPAVTAGSALRFAGRRRWDLLDADSTTVETYDWDDLRFSVSWKAYCFADEAERDTWRHHIDDLSEAQIVDRLVADLAERGVVAPDVPRDRDLGLTLIDHYVHFPAMAPPATA